MPEEKETLQTVICTPLKGGSCYASYAGTSDWCAVSKIEGEYKQVTGWLGCKDYLNELMWAHYSGFKAYTGIYYDPSLPDKFVPIDALKFRVGIVNADGIKGALNAMKVIHYLENLFEFKIKCKLRILEMKPTEGSSWPKNEKVLFEASKGWIKAPPLSSLFMTIARCCTKYDEETFKGSPLEYFLSCTDNRKVIKYSDSGYIRSAMSSGNLPILLKHGPKLFLKKIADNYRFKCESCGSTTYEMACCKNYGNHSIHSYGMLGWCEMSSEKDFCKRFGNTRGKKLFELRQQHKDKEEK